LRSLVAGAGLEPATFGL